MSNFDCIVVTCSSLKWATAIESELRILQARNIISKSVKILTVEDPASNIGSGAATLNALLVVTEYLSAHNGYTVVYPDVLEESRILILHHGREYALEPCGKAFMSLPGIHAASIDQINGHSTNLENLLSITSQMQENGPPGVWVCSTDMILTCRNIAINWPWVKDCLLICSACDPLYAAGHGAVKVNSEGIVSSILYCGTLEALHNYTRSDGTVLVVSGMVFFSSELAESLLALHSISPLDCCTYMGVDSGAEPMQMSLFFDLLVAMAEDVSQDSFVSGQHGRCYDKKFSLEKRTMAQRARKLVWNELSSYTLKAYVLEGQPSHHYLSNETTARQHSDFLINRASSDLLLHAFLDVNEKAVGDNAVLMNTLIRSGRCAIGSHSLLKNCCLEASEVIVGKNCYINGLTVNLNAQALIIPENTCIIQYIVCFEDSDASLPVVVTFGMEDQLWVPYTNEDGQVGQSALKEFLSFASVTEDDLWPITIPKLGWHQNCLMTAKLFTCSEESLQDALRLLNPTQDQKCLNKWKHCNRLSLVDVLTHQSLKDQFCKSWDTFFRVTSSIIKRTLMEKSDVLITPFMYAACACDREASLMAVLDSVAEGQEASKDLAIASRAFSCIADFLGAMAGNFGGLRSGPGGNKTWMCAFQLLEEGQVQKGALALKHERLKWMDRPDRMMRAARHYEGALQVLIRKAVLTTEKYTITAAAPCPPPFGEWAVAECPARMDLFGGWTDTPPICYELGGSVINIAVLVDGQKPIGAKARRIHEPHIVITLLHQNVPEKVEIFTMEDLLDYSQPGARGALLKACLIGSGVVKIDHEHELSQQLLALHGGGIELQSWSNLPQGSGLGTSSILAAAIVSALWTAVGRTFDKLAVIHCVLLVEQLLTTGGGWQDQVGGVTGGLVQGSSQPHLPLCVDIEVLPFSVELCRQLSNHFLLLYTGKVRLAKNLLQTVIRNWYTRDAKVVLCFKELLHLCRTSVRESFLKGDLEAIGKWLDHYWQLKKVLAAGCEPTFVGRLMGLLRPHVHGQLLLGAGGGGFLCALTKQPHQAGFMQRLLNETQGMSKVTVHMVEVDMTGLRLSINESNIEVPFASVH
ncbi:L-fucose kinase-like isoform X1 [Dermacentor variabilis]|uniref:L-fucose kinase-like isoform X1 n=1 Tax=Dermacentor variabilis TaxID=34621 RepID=UPI003F5CB6F8